MKSYTLSAGKDTSKERKKENEAKRERERDWSVLVAFRVVGFSGTWTGHLGQ